MGGCSANRSTRSAMWSILARFGNQLFTWRFGHSQCVTADMSSILRALPAAFNEKAIRRRALPAAPADTNPI